MITPLKRNLIRTKCLIREVPHYIGSCEFFVINKIPVKTENENRLPNYISYKFLSIYCNTTMLVSSELLYDGHVSTISLHSQSTNL